MYLEDRAEQNKACFISSHILYDFQTKQESLMKGSEYGIFQIDSLFQF